MTIKIPQSIQLYCKNNAVQTAIDSLMNRKINHSNKSLEEIENEYKAKLSTEKTKLDFFVFLHDAYKEVVIKTIKELNPEYINDLYQIENDDIDVSDSGEKCFGKSFVRNNQKIELYLYLTSEKDLRLAFSFSTDNKKEVYKDLQDYESRKYICDYEEGVCYSLFTQSIKITGEEKELDVSLLKEATKDFLKMIK
ncbi:MAG: hypothetical protein ACTSXL_00155 [Alphaproteobacteria bacterium]